MQTDTNNALPPREDDGEQLATPFFARFLEVQQVSGGDDGASKMTLKYPSDRDEWEPYQVV